MAIEFTSTHQQSTFYSPLEDFAETTVDVELRADPLTDRQTRIVPENFIVADDPDIESVVGDAEDCFFCPDSVGDVTPEYPDFVGMERGSVGEATSFPNLNPYGAHSNVVVLTEDHYVPIDEFAPSIFADGFEAAMEYVTAVFDHDEDATVASVNMNFLRSAGSSIIHPHVQTLVDDRGTNRQRRRLAAQREYYETNGTPFYDDLLDAERDGERYVGRTGAVEWYAPFAPQHHRHVRGVLDTDDVPAADADELADLATGLVAVLDHYADAGLNSFNFGFHVVADDPATRPVIDVVARSVFDRYYWSDATFFDTIHEESVVDVPPEEYALAVAAFL
jgi:galactose-1-phosphate uridylyltransferase